MGYLQEMYFKNILKLNDLGRMTHGYIAHLRKQKAIHGVQRSPLLMQMRLMNSDVPNTQYLVPNTFDLRK
jgi:hypothetical protein